MKNCNYFTYTHSLLSCLYYVPHHGEGGHIVFSADPVGVGIASCPHSISLLIGQILAKHTNISLGGGKMLIRFW